VALLPAYRCQGRFPERPFSLFSLTPGAVPDARKALPKRRAPAPHPSCVGGAAAVKGTLLLYRPGARQPEVSDFDREPSLDRVERTIGGRSETVAGFQSIEHRGTIYRCVALAERDAKTKNAPLNVAATLSWDAALRRDFGVTLLRAAGPRADALFGSVAVLFLHDRASAEADSRRLTTRGTRGAAE
jgi:hypothetical protein